MKIYIIIKWKKKKTYKIINNTNNSNNIYYHNKVTKYNNFDKIIYINIYKIYNTIL